MIYSLFFLCSILGQQLSFKRKHDGVVTIHGPWSRISKTSHLKLKHEVSRAEKKKLQDCDYVFGSSTTFQRRKEWMLSSKCSFTCICGIFLPLKPSTSTVYARSAFYPSLRSTLSLQSAFYTQSAFYPRSAVCSPQSAFYTDRFGNTG